MKRTAGALAGKAPRRHRAPTAPQTAQHPHTTVDGRIDEYAWLRDDQRRHRAVLAQLRAENRYAQRWFAGLGPLPAILEAEARRRIPPSDEGLPVRRGDFLYWWKDRPGRDHPSYWRRPLLGGAAQLLLDAERRSGGAPGYELGALAVSPDGRWLAVSEDRLGSGVYQLRIRDLQRRRWLAECIDSVDAEVAWAADSRHLFYVHRDAGTLAALEVRRHRRGRPVSEDARVHREVDPAFYLSLYATHSHRHLVIHAEATRRTRLLRIDAGSPLSVPQPLPLPGGHDQSQRLRYDDDGQHGWLMSDWQAPDFRLWRAELATLAEPQSDGNGWRLHPAAEHGVVLEDFLPLPGERLVLVERRNAQLGLRLCQAGQPDRWLYEPDGLSALVLDDNPEPDPAALRVRRERWESPGETLALDFASGALTLLKRDALGGEFDPLRYASRRLWIEAADGARIPVSLLGRCEVLAAGAAPLWLHGYGAYGASLDPVFDADALSLLDRGVLIAHAHVRGGGELGTGWHDAGRLQHKSNSSGDLLAVADALVAQAIADPRRIVAVGASAGGLLVADALNRAPQRFCAALLQVPFVDVLSSMLDPELPLTQLEYAEWGDPTQPEQYAAMARWSPYDGLRPAPYPPVLATTALHDAQVGYWEAAKYIARLRRLSTGAAPALLRVEFGSGHQGHSGRYGSVADSALELAFALRWLVDQG